MKLPVWVSWTLDENEPKLRSGESIRTALGVLHSAGLLSESEDNNNASVSALLFNCTCPEVITLALRCEARTTCSHRQ